MTETNNINYSFSEENGLQFLDTSKLVTGKDGQISSEDAMIIANIIMANSLGRIADQLVEVTVAAEKIVTKK